MSIHQIYSTEFILNDLAETYFSLPSAKKRIYTKLVDCLKEPYIKLLVEKNGIGTIEELKKNKDQGELSEAKFKLLISLVDRGSIEFANNEGEPSSCIDKITARNTQKRKFIAAQEDVTSSVFYDELGNESLEKEIGKCLKKALIKKTKIGEGSIEYLFETQELEPIKKGTPFKWYDYLKSYGIHTNRIYIRDPYFYSNINGKLNKIIGPLLTASYSDSVRVEIISDLSALGLKKEDSKDKILNWIDSHDDRLEIICYDQRGSASSLFHDRYIFTDYWVLKVAAGLDVEKEGLANKYTNPTLVGRYAPTGSSWEYINENWDEWKELKCKSIN